MICVSTIPIFAITEHLPLDQVLLSLTAQRGQGDTIPVLIGPINLYIKNRRFFAFCTLIEGYLMLTKE